MRTGNTHGAVATRSRTVYFQTIVSSVSPATSYLGTTKTKLYNIPMSVQKLPQALLAGLHYKDAEAVTRTLVAFANAGAKELHIIADFDLTLTAGTKAGQNLGTWDVMDVLMPPAGVERHREIYQSFRPIELEGKLTQKIAKEKWSETLDLICSYRLSIDEVEKAFLSVATLRKGAKEVFEACKQNAVPSVILSAGIKDIIELIAAYYSIEPSIILSTKLKLDQDRRISGWQKDTLVHMLNKKEVGHAELSELRKTRPKVILLGDVPDDVHMVAGDEDVIRVRVLDPREGEVVDLKHALQSSFAAGYDLVVERDLFPVARMITWVADSMTR